MQFYDHHVLSLSSKTLTLIFFAINLDDRCSERTSFDTTISIFAHSDLSGCTVVCLGQNDDHGFTDLDFCSPSAFHSLAVLESEPDTYYIAISGRSPQDVGLFDFLLFTIEDDSAPSPTPPAPTPTLPAPTPSGGGGGGSCPFDTAIPLRYDPEGFVVSGTTFGSTPNLPTIDGCSIDNGSPTKWYQFTISASVTIGMTT